MAAVRVPPSAWRTSQSRMMLRSPRAARSTMERNDRPIRRWISMVRPDARPFETSRGVREVRNGVLDGSRAQHLGVADFDQDRTFGCKQVVLGNFERAQLVRFAL